MFIISKDIQLAKACISISYKPYGNITSFRHLHAQKQLC